MKQRMILKAALAGLFFEQKCSSDGHLYFKGADGRETVFASWDEVAGFLEVANHA